MPQEKSENYLEFSERTEGLAASLRINLGDLPAIIGISPATFYGHRSGKILPISEKTWRKLEKAEKEAGIVIEKTPPETSRVMDQIATPAQQELEQMTRRALAAEQKVELMKKILRSLLDQL